ncbi:MAG: thioredoxin domain-containing protein [Elainellaceae cyanobacterium]
MPNHLATAKSLYLRKHADNPIDWWPWCDEALTLARSQNRPIFLSIGYSSCHWCTVMEGEAFSDEAIAAYMNANFVPIKVDREERPDLDSIYMQALQMMAGQGGWPLNVFLTPSRVPFYGGTYFPVAPRYGRPGFLEVLQAIRRFYDNEADELREMTSQMMTQLQQLNQLSVPDPAIADPAATGSAPVPPPEQLATGLEYCAGVLSASGPGPRFPMIPYADGALRGVRFERESRYDAAALVQQRGLNLVLGGICDHVGGGFHRYTVDPTWTVPHFEKMLYDNGQIMEYLSNLWSLGEEEPAYWDAIQGAVAWLRREMTAPEGYFYAAQDADSFINPEASEPEEGAFYVWDYADLADWLSEDELEQLSRAFDIAPSGNFEGHIVLQRQRGGALDPSLQPILDTLFRQRYGIDPGEAQFPPARTAQEAKSQTWPGRIPPVTDTKMIVAWNSLMISGLARAAAVFNQAEFYELAAQAARFILDCQWQDQRLYRLNYGGVPSVPAQAEDYALLIKALLDLDQAALALHEAADWSEAADRVQREFDQRLWSEAGGYFNTAEDVSDDVLVRERSYSDSATPSANGVAIANLVRLSLRQENLDYLDQAEQALSAFAPVMARSPQSCPSLFVALDWYQNHTLLKTTAEQAKAAIVQYAPVLVSQVASLPEGAVGLVCQGLSCREPAQSLAQLRQQITDSQRRSG